MRRNISVKNLKTQYFGNMRILTNGDISVKDEPFSENEERFTLSLGTTIIKSQPTFGALQFEYSYDGGIAGRNIKSCTVSSTSNPGDSLMWDLTFRLQPKENGVYSQSPDISTTINSASFADPRLDFDFIEVTPTEGNQFGRAIGMMSWGSDSASELYKVKININGINVDHPLTVYGNKIIFPIPDHWFNAVDKTWSIPNNQVRVKMWKTGSNLVPTARTLLDFTGDDSRDEEVKIVNNVGDIKMIFNRWDTLLYQPWKDGTMKQIPLVDSYWINTDIVLDFICRDDECYNRMKERAEKDSWALLTVNEPNHPASGTSLILNREFIDADRIIKVTIPRDWFVVMCSVEVENSKIIINGDSELGTEFPDDMFDSI